MKTHCSNCPGYNIDADRIENTVPLFHSGLLGCPHDRSSVIAYQRPLFTEPLLSSGCFIAAYFVVVAQQRVYVPQYHEESAFTNS
jgi:hypothetical protein